LFDALLKEVLDDPQCSFIEQVSVGNEDVFGVTADLSSSTPETLTVKFPGVSRFPGMLLNSSLFKDLLGSDMSAPSIRLQSLKARFGRPQVMRLLVSTLEECDSRFLKIAEFSVAAFWVLGLSLLETRLFSLALRLVDPLVSSFNSGDSSGSGDSCMTLGLSAFWEGFGTGMQLSDVVSDDTLTLEEAANALAFFGDNALYFALGPTMSPQERLFTAEEVGSICLRFSNLIRTVDSEFAKPKSEKVFGESFQLQDGLVALLALELLVCFHGPDFSADTASLLKAFAENSTHIYAHTKISPYPEEEVLSDHTLKLVEMVCASFSPLNVSAGASGPNSGPPKPLISPLAPVTGSTLSLLWNLAVLASDALQGWDRGALVIALAGDGADPVETLPAAAGPTALLLLSHCHSEIWLRVLGPGLPLRRVLAFCGRILDCNASSVGSDAAARMRALLESHGRANDPEVFSAQQLVSIRLSEVEIEHSPGRAEKRGPLPDVFTPEGLAALREALPALRKLSTDPVACVSRCQEILTGFSNVSSSGVVRAEHFKALRWVYTNSEGLPDDCIKERLVPCVLDVYCKALRGELPPQSAGTGNPDGDVRAETLEAAFSLLASVLDVEESPMVNYVYMQAQLRSTGRKDIFEKIGQGGPFASAEPSLLAGFIQLMVGCECATPAEAVPKVAEITKIVVREGRENHGNRGKRLESEMASEPAYPDNAVNRYLFSSLSLTPLGLGQDGNQIPGGLKGQISSIFMDLYSLDIPWIYDVMHDSVVSAFRENCDSVFVVFSTIGTLMQQKGGGALAQQARDAFVLRMMALCVHVEGSFPASQFFSAQQCGTMLARAARAIEQFEERVAEVTRAEDGGASGERRESKEAVSESPQAVQNGSMTPLDRAAESCDPNLICAGLHFARNYLMHGKPVIWPQKKPRAQGVSAARTGTPPAIDSLTRIVLSATRLLTTLPARQESHALPEESDKKAAEVSDASSESSTSDAESDNSPPAPAALILQCCISLALVACRHSQKTAAYFVLGPTSRTLEAALRAALRQTWKDESSLEITYAVLQELLEPPRGALLRNAALRPVAEELLRSLDSIAGAAAEGEEEDEEEGEEGEEGS